METADIINAINTYIFVAWKILYNEYYKSVGQKKTFLSFGFCVKSALDSLF